MFYNVQIPLTVKSLEEESKRKSTLLDGRSLESWDYVYRQLESIGYTKDQSERPDVLALLNKVTMARQRTEEMEKVALTRNMRTSTPEALSPLSHAEVELLRHIKEARITPRPNPESAAEGGGGDEVDAVHHRFKGRERDRGSGVGSGGGDGGAGSSSAGGSLRKKSDPNKRKSLRHSRPLSPPQNNNASSSNGGGGPSSRWQCHACTYSNKAKNDICEMCGKSKNSPIPPASSAADVVNGGGSRSESTTGGGGHDVVDGQSPDSDGRGGVSCQKCTLVNDRKLKESFKSQKFLQIKRLEKKKKAWQTLSPKMSSLC